MESLPGGNAKSSFFFAKESSRIINHKQYNSHTDPLLKLSDLYQLQVMPFMHNNTRNKLPLSFRNIFTLNRDMNVVHETRQVNMFHVIKYRCKFIDK